MHVLPAHVISVNSGLLCSFLMNTKINFRTPDKLIRRFFMFFAIAWVGLAFSSALMVFMVEYLHLYDVGFQDLHHHPGRAVPVHDEQTLHLPYRQDDRERDQKHF